VYDMYPCYGAPAASAPAAAPVPAATSAVQVALDRRDNGGDAAAEPTAGRTRQ
jgi:hypothetical protein